MAEFPFKANKIFLSCLPWVLRHSHRAGWVLSSVLSSALTICFLILGALLSPYFLILLPFSLGASALSARILTQVISKHDNGVPVVLIAEDEPDIALLYSWYLKVEGMITIERTSDFADLLDGRTWMGVNVAVVDLNLGAEASLTGVEVLRFLKLYEPKVRRVVATAHAVPDEVVDLADAVLVKPFAIDEFVGKVKGSTDLTQPTGRRSR